MCSLILSAFLIFHHHHQIQNFRAKPSRTLFLFYFSALVTRGNLNLRSLCPDSMAHFFFLSLPKGVHLMSLFFPERNAIFCLNIFFLFSLVHLCCSICVCCNDSESQFWDAAPKWSSNVLVFFFPALSKDCVPMWIVI